jgi:hypothetical protein
MFVTEEIIVEPHSIDRNTIYTAAHINRKFG